MNLLDRVKKTASGNLTFNNALAGMMLDVHGALAIILVKFMLSVRPPKKSNKTFSNIFRQKLHKGVMIFSIFYFYFLALCVDCCPTGGDTFWVELGDSCYSISRQPMDWGTAQEVENISLNFNF